MLCLTNRKNAGIRGNYCNTWHKNYGELCRRAITWNDEKNGLHNNDDGSHSHGIMRLHGKDRNYN